MYVKYDSFVQDFAVTVAYKKRIFGLLVVEIEDINGYNMKE